MLIILGSRLFSNNDLNREPSDTLDVLATTPASYNAFVNSIGWKRVKPTNPFFKHRFDIRTLTHPSDTISVWEGTNFIQVSPPNGFMAKWLQVNEKELDGYFFSEGHYLELEYHWIDLYLYIEILRASCLYAEYFPHAISDYCNLKEFADGKRSDSKINQELYAHALTDLGLIYPDHFSNFKSIHLDEEIFKKYAKFSLKISSPEQMGTESWDKLHNKAKKDLITYVVQTMAHQHMVRCPSINPTLAWRRCLYDFLVYHSPRHVRTFLVNRLEEFVLLDFQRMKI